MKRMLTLLMGVLCASLSLHAQVFYEDFNSGIASSQFTQNYITGNLNWKTNNPNIGGVVFPYAGSRSASFYKQSYYPYETELTSPSMDLSSGTYVLSFYHVQKEWDGDVNELSVYLSVDGGGSWIEIVTYTSNVSDWALGSFELNNYAALTSNCQIKFIGNNNYGYPIGLDEVTVDNGCSGPNDLTVDYVTADAAGISWSGSTGTYNIEYGPNGFSQGSGTRVDGVNSNDLRITGLNALTTYDFYVQADCGTEQSAWSGPDSIITGTATFPYFEDFSTAESWITAGDFWWYLESVVQVNGETGWASNAEFYWNDAGDTSIMFTPVLDLRTLNQPMLNFYSAYRSYASQNDGLKISISSDGGKTFNDGIPVYFDQSYNTSPSLATTASSTDWYAPASVGDWRHTTIDLSDFAGDSTVMIAFKATSDWGNNLYIDDIKVSEYETSETFSIVASGPVVSTKGVEIDFTDHGTGGNLIISRFDSAPQSYASNEFKNNLTATTSSGSVYTPEQVLSSHWFNITYTGSDYSAGPVYDVVVDLSFFSGYSDADEIYLLKRADETDSWEALPTTHSGGKLYAYGFTQFSDFGVGMGGSPLAVEMLDFSGQQQQSTIRLDWTTATETNNSHFEVERSSNGKSFESIDKVQGAGNSTNVIEYFSIDNNPLPGGAYYRIKSVETDGKADFSEIIFVAFQGPVVSDVSIYPNPASSLASVDMQAEFSGIFQLQVSDNLGRIVHRQTIEVVEGLNTLQFDVGLLPEGLYFIDLSNASGINSTHRLQVNR